MKKIIGLLILSILSLAVNSVVAQSTSPRFGINKNDDNTGRVLNHKLTKYTFVSGADTLKLTPSAWQTLVQPDSLADSLMVKIVNIKQCNFGDKIYFTAIAKGASRKIKLVTTNLSSAGTLTCAQNKRVTIVFMFDGIKWVEICRYTES